MKFKITFKHTVELTYEAIIEADSKESAEVYFHEDPFGYVEGNAIDEDGITIEIEEISEIE